MATRLANWLDERVGWRQVWNAIFLRKIPKVNWLYTLGSASLFVAINQIVTGILLTIYYVPTPDHAYDSVQYITTQVPAGWLIRGLHHWGASAMVVLVVLHMLRVIYYGAYKFPREVTWTSGVLLLITRDRFWVYWLFAALGPKSILGYHGRHAHRCHAAADRQHHFAHRARRRGALGGDAGALFWRPYLGAANCLVAINSHPYVPGHPYRHQRYSETGGIGDERKRKTGVSGELPPG